MTYRTTQIFCILYLLSHILYPVSPSFPNPFCDLIKALNGLRQPLRGLREFLWGLWEVSDRISEASDGSWWPQTESQWCLASSQKPQKSEMAIRILGFLRETCSGQRLRGERWYVQSCWPFILFLKAPGRWLKELVRWLHGISAFAKVVFFSCHGNQSLFTLLS